MLVFISLIVYLEIKKKLNTKFTVEATLIEMGNLMCKSFKETTLVLEPTKIMFIFYSKLNLIVKYLNLCNFQYVFL
jgi:hypothetical protein